MKVTQSFAGQSVLDIVHMLYQLCLVILHPDCVIQNWSVHVQVHVFVDGNGQDKSFMLSVEGWKVGAPTTQGDSKWSFRNDHSLFTNMFPVHAKLSMTSTQFCCLEL